MHCPACPAGGKEDLTMPKLYEWLSNAGPKTRERAEPLRKYRTPGGKKPTFGRAMGRNKAAMLLQLKQEG